MTRGRKPLPNRVHDIHGNPGKRARNGAEPKPREAVPTCPAHLDAEAKKRWRQVVKELRANGLLTLLDRDFLSAYCVVWSRWAYAEAQVAKAGPVLSHQPLDADGNPDGPPKFYPNPYLAVANAALRQLHSFGSEFGMSPSARTRLKVETAPVSDPFELFLSGAGTEN